MSRAATRVPRAGVHFSIEGCNERQKSKFGLPQSQTPVVSAGWGSRRLKNLGNKREEGEEGGAGAWQLLGETTLEL